MPKFSSPSAGVINQRQMGMSCLGAMLWFWVLKSVTGMIQPLISFMWNSRAFGYQANVLQNCLRKGSWLRQSLSLFNWSPRVIKRLLKASVWLPVAQKKILGIFFSLYCLCTFIFGSITEPEPTTSPCLFSGVRLHESGGEASKGPWRFWCTFEFRRSVPGGRVWALHRALEGWSPFLFLV